MDSFVFFEQEVYFAVHENRPLSFVVEGCHNMNEMWRLFILCPIALWPVVKTQ